MKFRKLGLTFEIESSWSEKNIKKLRTKLHDIEATQSLMHDTKTWKALSGAIPGVTFDINIFSDSVVLVSNCRFIKQFRKLSHLIHQCFTVKSVSIQFKEESKQ